MHISNSQAIIAHLFKFTKSPSGSVSGWSNKIKSPGIKKFSSDDEYVAPVRGEICSESSQLEPGISILSVKPQLHLLGARTDIFKSAAQFVGVGFKLHALCFPFKFVPRAVDFFKMMFHVSNVTYYVILVIIA